MYEYECRDCHRRLEKIQSFSAAPITVCPTCGGQLERTLTAPAIQFKGAGWYVNDYAKSGGEKKSSGSNSDAKSGDSGGAKDSGATSGSSSGEGSKTGSGESSTKSEGASSSKESASAPAASSSSSLKSD